jgi:hypothetical protein
MAREIDSPVDQLHEDGARAKRAAKAAIDPREFLIQVGQNRQKKIKRKLLILRMTCLERFVWTV